MNDCVNVIVRNDFGPPSDKSFSVCFEKNQTISLKHVPKYSHFISICAYYIPLRISILISVCNYVYWLIEIQFNQRFMAINGNMNRLFVAVVIVVHDRVKNAKEVLYFESWTSGQFWCAQYSFKAFAPFPLHASVYCRLLTRFSL